MILSAGVGSGHIKMKPYIIPITAALCTVHLSGKNLAEKPFRLQSVFDNPAEIL